VAAIVLVEALGVKEVDVGYGCVGDFDCDICARTRFWVRNILGLEG
jgi:hypothetical protein